MRRRISWILIITVVVVTVSEATYNVLRDNTNAAAANVHAFQLIDSALQSSTPDGANIDFPIPPIVPVVPQLRQEFPQWLHDLTGLSEWPNNALPYIPMPGILDLTKIPDIGLRELGDCRGVTREDCSFDCYQCSTENEIVSCPVLSQTFDDGPSPSTPKLLSELRYKTTFFTQGINVVRFPEIFRQQNASGHLLATHTWNHAHLPSLTNEQIAAQIQWSVWAMNATAGLIPRYFRPPYGGMDNRVRAIVEQFGLVSVFWDRDTFDWKINDNKKLEIEVFHDVSMWLAEKPTGLILEHDSTIKTVNLGVQVSRMLGDHQMTVAECVNGPWYQSTLPKVSPHYHFNGIKEMKHFGASSKSI